MTNLATALKEEVRRLARKEIRAAVDPLRRITTTQRRQIAALKQQVATLERSLKRASKGSPAVSQEDADESGTKRFAPRGVIAHRKKLKMSAAEYGKLLGVTGQTIYKWEAGKARPRPSQLALWLQLRDLGPREVASLAGA